MCGCNSGCAPCAAKKRREGFGFVPEGFAKLRAAVGQVRTIGQAHALALWAAHAHEEAADALAGMYVGGKFTDEAAAAKARADAIAGLRRAALALRVQADALEALRRRGMDAAPLPSGHPLVTGDPPLALAGLPYLEALAPHAKAYEEAAHWFASRLAESVYRVTGAGAVLPPVFASWGAFGQIAVIVGVLLLLSTMQGGARARVY